MTKSRLTEADFQAAADALGVEVAAIKAVDATETAGKGFEANGEPVILFERHIFHRKTKGRFSRQHPDISNPTPGGYGSQASQHARLRRAVALDRQAALLSASWGRFQIMGFNHQVAGFNTVQGLINAMYKSERAQLDAFVNYLKNEGLADELRRHDWAGFARKYNGPAYRKNNYDTKLARFYAKFKREEEAREAARPDFRNVVGHVDTVPAAWGTTPKTWPGYPGAGEDDNQD